jgi:hypothetical protein
MTVQQLIDSLRLYPPDSLVYIPISQDGANGTVQFVGRFPHTNLPVPGISITEDVALFPGEMERFVVAPDAPDEERQGES